MPYFDYNATAPLAPVARETWLRLSDEAWHNPSSPTRDGARARLRLDAARQRLGEFLGAKPERIVFNSGATEGAHSVLAHWARTLPKTTRLAINPTEHPCVLEAARFSFAERIIPLELTGDGVVKPEALEKCFADASRSPERAPLAVVVMAANNETGVLQPWRELGALCARHRAPFLCDATQWLGKLPAAGLGEIGWVIGSAHKFGGPKGCGFVVLPGQAESFCAQPGGAQENGHRSGTENLPAIAAGVAALAEAEQARMFLEEERLRWRREFEHAVVTALPGTRIVAAEAERLWNTVALIPPYAENTRWVAKLDKRGFQVSTGSACATGKEGPSPVLAALGVPPEQARRVVRVSGGWETTADDWRALADAFSDVAKEIAPAPQVISP